MLLFKTQLDVLEDRVAVYTDQIASLDAELAEHRKQLEDTSVTSIEAQVQPYKDQIAQLDASMSNYEQLIQQVELDTSAVEPIQAQIAQITDAINKVEGQLASGEREQIKQAQLTIGSNPDGAAGPNTRRSANTWIGLQKERITTLQQDIARLQAESVQRQSTERDRLTGLVLELQTRKQSLLDAIDQIHTDAISAAGTAKADIQSKIDANRTARNTAQEAITKLRQADDPRINAARDTIAQLRLGADAQIAASNDLIQRLRDRIRVDGGADVDAIVDEQTDRIRTANAEIDKLTEQKYTIEAEYRKLEAEVGPIKYIAEFIYEEADRDVLEEAVRWVIITIIFVFDPLAVLLLIASQYTFEWRRNDKSTNEPIAVDEAEPTEGPEPVAQEEEAENKEEVELEFIKAPPEDYSEDDEEIHNIDAEVSIARAKDTSIDDEQLTKHELGLRMSMFPSGYSGKLIPTGSLAEKYKELIKKHNEQ